jgi:hypothetical protein
MASSLMFRMSWSRPENSKGGQLRQFYALAAVGTAMRCLKAFQIVPGAESDSIQNWIILTSGKNSCKKRIQQSSSRLQIEVFFNCSPQKD